MRTEQGFNFLSLVYSHGELDSPSNEQLATSIVPSGDEQVKVISVASSDRRHPNRGGGTSVKKGRINYSLVFTDHIVIFTFYHNLHNYIK